MRNVRAAALAALAALLIALAAVVVAFGSPRVVKRVSVASSGWILDDYAAGAESRLSLAHRKLLGTYLQHRLAGRFAATGAGDDADRILATMVAVRGVILDHAQVRHPARNRPVLIAGIASCDQKNGIVADALAGSFDRSELFAVYDPVKKWSPHTIGRVWSDQHDDWLYFDSVYEEAIVFRKIDGKAVVLRRSGAPKMPQAARGYAPAGLYDLDGWTLNEYKSTYLGYLGLKVMRRLSGEVVDPRTTAMATTAAGLERRRAGRKRAAPPRDNPLFARVSQAYLKARLTHLLYGLETARPSYAAVAATPNAAADARARELVQAARVFAAVRD